jgi:hypothetical protein
MYASEQELSGVRVPQIMEADARNVLKAADKARELVRQNTGLVRVAVGAGANQRLAGLPDAEGK